jgi:hypothetical protein
MFTSDQLRDHIRLASVPGIAFEWSINGSGTVLERLGSDGRQHQHHGPAHAQQRVQQLRLHARQVQVRAVVVLAARVLIPAQAAAVAAHKHHHVCRGSGCQRRRKAARVCTIHVAAVRQRYIQAHRLRGQDRRVQVDQMVVSPVVARHHPGVVCCGPYKGEARIVAQRQQAALVAQQRHALERGVER